MTRLRILPILLALAFLSSCIMPNGGLPAIKRATTDQGHEVYYIPMDGEVVTIHAAFQSNYIFTEGANPAVPHVALPLIQQAAAGNIKRAMLVEEFERLDARAELYARTDAIHGVLVADVGDIEAAAKIANQVLNKSTLDERWFRRIAANLAEDAAMDRRHSGVIGWGAMRQLSFDPQVARFWTTSLEDIQAITHAQIKDWYEQSFYADDAIIVLSGPEDMTSGLRAVDALLDGLDQKKPREAVATQQAFEPVAKTILIENKAASDSLVLLFGHLTGQSRAREIETMISVYELGGTSSSRLHLKLRDELRAAYEVFAKFVDFDREVRLLAMGGQVAPDQAADALAAASDVYDQMRSTGFEQAAFDRAKKVYFSHFETLLNGDNLPTNFVIDALLEGHEPEFVYRLLPTVGGMNLATQNEYVKTHLAPADRLLRIVVAPNIDAIEVKADCRVKRPDDLLDCG
ncbi:hypothetical protein MXMO3_02887 [Maritalea myrionectae]|uniref:Peptidase M16 C-terminal domain-containing protein n=1 Tax=Maritalea myrionectae TaxID=454601 RepID=A0A2R4MH47_9HYPH|nr:insulinase family protein [Maritalea myrionectae]AVX05397.1 hypothetical protein MXMO3_02887 [Maritalea myrionectae]